jgi:hypothetical protein
MEDKFIDRFKMANPSKKSEYFFVLSFEIWFAFQTETIYGTSYFHFHRRGRHLTKMAPQISFWQLFTVVITEKMRKKTWAIFHKKLVFAKLKARNMVNIKFRIWKFWERGTSSCFTQKTPEPGSQIFSFPILTV